MGLRAHQINEDIWVRLITFIKTPIPLTAVGFSICLLWYLQHLGTYHCIITNLFHILKDYTLKHNFSKYLCENSCCTETTSDMLSNQ